MENTSTTAKGGTLQKMYMLIAISRKRDQEEFEEVFDRHGVPQVFSLPCHGTTQETTLNLLGLETSEKMAYFAPLTHNTAVNVMDAMTHELHIDLPERGIALLLPLSSISGESALRVFADGHEYDEMIKEPYMMDTGKELIVVICENGHIEEVMQAARAGGAGGGTVLHAKGTGTAMAQKFWGITLAEEKEMVMIVTRTEHKKGIMRSIATAAGPATPARAVSFSLPVTDTAGLRFFEE